MSNEGIKEKVSGQPWWVVFVEGIVLVVGGIAAIVMSFRIDDSSPQGAQV